MLYLQLHKVVNPWAHEIDTSAPPFGCVRGESAIQVKQEDGPRVFWGLLCFMIQEALSCLRRVTHRPGGQPGPIWVRWERDDIALVT